MSTDTKSLTSNEAIRAELESWLDENWSPDRSLLAWRDILVDGGWAAPGWPSEYFGRGFDRIRLPWCMKSSERKVQWVPLQLGPEGWHLKRYWRWEMMIRNAGISVLS